MTRKQVVIGISIVGFILILSPFLGAAAQRAITVDSLEKAYISRVTELDAEIAAATIAANSLIFPSTTRKEDWATFVARSSETRKELTSLEEERRTLEYTYRFMQEALK